MMCIYLKDSDELLTYNTREHVLPAGLGCRTVLEKGIVSDQANEYFSSIERDVIKHSLIQIQRTLIGPGKRGKLNKKPTTQLSRIIQNGQNYLGYMEGTKGCGINQFIIDEKNNIQFYCEQYDEIDLQNEIEKLKKHILLIGEKYVPVEMPQDDKKIYIAYFDKKIHIGANRILSNNRIQEIKNLFSGNISVGEKYTSCGQITIAFDIKHNIKNLAILAIKSALNTLAYIKGSEYITKVTYFNDIINQVMTNSDAVLNNVKGIFFNEVKKIREDVHINNDELACLLIPNKNILDAYLFIYDFCFRVSLPNNYCINDFGVIDGIVCDFKKPKDYRYMEFLKLKGVLS